MASSFPDGHFCDDLLVFNGLNDGGYISKGFQIDAPDYRYSDDEQLDAHSIAWRIVLSELAPDVRYQIRWKSDSDYRRELLAYNDRTVESGATGWFERTRSERFARAWQAMEAGKLRRERLSLYATYKISKGALGIGKKSGRALYTGLLDAYGKRADAVFHRLDSSLGPLGGMIHPMRDEDYFFDFYSFFDKSEGMSRFPKEMLLQRFDPRGSIQKNCWHKEGNPLRDLPFGFYMGGKYHGILALKIPPKSTSMNSFLALTTLAMKDYAITVNIEGIESTELQANLQKAFERDNGDYLASVAKAKPDLALRTKMEMKAERLEKLVRGEVFPCRFQFIIHTWADTPQLLQGKISTLRAAVIGMGMAETYEPTCDSSTRKFWTCTIPGWAWDSYKACWNVYDDTNLTHILPVSTTPVGDLEGGWAIYDDANGGLMGINQFQGPKGQEAPQHSMTFGASGSGKSVWKIDYYSQIFPMIGKMVIIEEGMSYATLTELAGSKPIIIREDGDITINYLDTEGSPLSASQIRCASSLALIFCGESRDEDRQRLRNTLIEKEVIGLYNDFFEAWKRKNPDKHSHAVRLALTLEKWQKEKMPMGSTFLDAFKEFQEIQNQTPETAKALLEEWNETEMVMRSKERQTGFLIRDTAFSMMTREEMPRHGQLAERIKSNAVGVHKEEMAAIAAYMEPWRRGGSYGCLFDGITNIDLNEKMVHFELGYISEAAALMKKAAAFLIGSIMRLKLMLLPRSMFKMLEWEEISRAMDMPGGSQLIKEFFTGFRKYNVCINGTCQQFEQFAKSDAKSSIMGNASTFFILRQKDPKDLAWLASEMPQGLPENTQEMILSLPEPQKVRGVPYSGFIYYRTAFQRPLIVASKHYASKEMAYASSSAGAQYEKRKAALRQYPDTLTGIITEAAQ